MPYQVIAEGTANDITALGNYEGSFEEGSRGYLQVDLKSSVAADVMSWLDDALEKAGVPEKKLEVSGNSLLIHFKKEIAPLVLIAGAIAACILIAGLIIAWKLWKLTPGIVVGISTLAIIAIIFAIIAAVVVIAKTGRLIAGPVKVGK